MEIEHGLCDLCSKEIHDTTWGQVKRKHVSVSKMTKDEVAAALKYNREMGEAAGNEFNRLTKEAATDCVIVASFFDDYAQGDGKIDALICKRNLREALDSLS